MPAFTHLCKKTNISIAHNTITLYEKNGFEFGSFYEPKNPNDPFIKKIAPVKPVYREHQDHGYYHEDLFDKEIQHYHMKFKVPINEARLNQFLFILIDKHIIDADEKHSCLKAFQQASNDLLIPFHLELEHMQSKLHRLIAKALIHPKKYRLAVNAATKLSIRLKDELNQYEKDRNRDSYNEFQKNCTAAIKEAHSILAKHRDWTDILINLGAAIAGLGVLYLVAIGINYLRTRGQELFFHYKTDSEQVLDQCDFARKNMLRI